jgi:hypothetical protein
VAPVITGKTEPITKLRTRRDQSSGGNKHRNEHAGSNTVLTVPTLLRANRNLQAM